jgi:SAM-dependent methyltransferase
MYGSAPSEAAVAAAAMFGSNGARRVLELGAGQGRDSVYLLGEGFDVIALEFADAALRALAAKRRSSPTGGSLVVVGHDARDPLPLAAGSIDACFSHMLFCMALSTEHLERLCRELRRVIRPGGLVTYTVRHTGDAHFGAGQPRGDGMFENGGFVVHFFDRALVDRLAAGFHLREVVEFTEGGLPRRLWRVTMHVPD